jgi:hypothetical protein
MSFDELLLGAVLVMLIASTYMGWCVQRALYHSRHAMIALRDEYMRMSQLSFELNERVGLLEYRLRELER